jgi:DNA-binding NarL/FixJ family response regulator
MNGDSKALMLCRNRLLRESIARILTKKTKFEVVVLQGPFPMSANEIADLRAEVLILDSLQFLVSGPESPPELIPLGRLVKCVLIAMEDDHDHFLTAVQCGAKGYVLQEASASDVVSVVSAVAEGQAVCPPHFTRVLFDYIAMQTEKLPSSRRYARWGLTVREQQLIPLIERGASNKEIANHLNLSEQTVKNHIYRIFRKIGVSDRLRVSEALRNQSVYLSAKNAASPS